MIAPSCEDGGKQKVTRTRTRCQAPSEHSLATLCRHGIFQDSVSCANEYACETGSNLQLLPAHNLPLSPSLVRLRL